MIGRTHTHDTAVEKDADLGSDDIARRNIALVERIERTANRGSRGEAIAESLTCFFGSTPFIWIHLCWFTIWITLNVLPHVHHWDQFPFSFLTLTVSLEAIFLTIFILMAQNRQGELADQRNKLDLQINLLAEQESSKTIAMLEAIMKRLGIPIDDPEIAAFATPTHPERVLEQIQHQTQQSGEHHK